MKTIKQFTKREVWAAAFFITLNGIAGKAFAQTTVPEKVDVHIDTGSNTMWYTQPWVWVLGVALFIIIIIAITRNGSREV